jgi:WD40 repeat protein
MALTALPREIICRIGVNHLRADEIAMWQMTCKVFRDILGGEALWESVYERDFLGRRLRFPNFNQGSLAPWITRMRVVKGTPFVTTYPKLVKIAGWSAVQVSPYDKQTVVVGEAYPGRVKVWNWETDRYQMSYQLPDGNVTSIAIMSPERFTTSSQDGVKVWDLHKVKITAQLPRVGAVSLALAKASDTEVIAGSYQGKITLWDLNHQTYQTWQDCHTDVIDTLIRSNDTLIFSGSGDKTIKTWDPRTTSCVQTFHGHTNGVMSLIQPNDRTLISASDDKTIKVWDIRTSGYLQTLAGHKNKVTAMTAFDEETLLSGSDDKTVKVWKWKTGECAQTYGPYSNTVQYLVKSDDGVIFSKIQQQAPEIWDFTKPSSQSQLTFTSPRQPSYWAAVYHSASKVYKWLMGS